MNTTPHEDPDRDTGHKQSIFDQDRALVLADIALKIRNGILLSSDEVAAFSGRHPESVRRALRLGNLRGTRPIGTTSWVITRDALADWLRISLDDLMSSVREHNRPPGGAASSATING